jgi:hypothetical protein
MVMVSKTRPPLRSILPTVENFWCPPRAQVTETSPLGRGILTRATIVATPMPRSFRRRGPKPDRRRALELLAATPEGCTEALMFANGFSAELLIELVRAGLVSAHAERVVGDGKMTEVARVKLSEAGWQALAADAINARAKST